MKEFNQVTKVLKRCWKEKVTITTATVVAFLMGANVYAQDIVVPDDGTPINITINKGETVTNSIRNNQPSPIQPDSANIINNGEIKLVLNNGNGDLVHGIRMYEIDNVNVENNGTIFVERTDTTNSQSSKAVGIEVKANKQGNVVNNGEITVKVAQKSGNNPSGMILAGKVNGVNNGTVSVEGGPNTVGVSLLGNGDFVNNGIIDISKSTNAFGIRGSHTNNGLIENKGTIVLNGKSESKAIESNGQGTVVNTGKIQIKDLSDEEIKKLNIKDLIVSRNKPFIDKGMIVNEKGEAVIKTEDILVEGVINGDVLNQIISNTNGKVVINDGTVLTEIQKPLAITALNVVGKVETTKGVILQAGNINLDKNGVVVAKDYLVLDKVTVNGTKEKSDIVVDGMILLNNSNINGNIASDPALAVVAKENQLYKNGSVYSFGDTRIDGTIGVTNLYIGANNSKNMSAKKNITTFTSTSKIQTGTTINIAQNGQLALQLGTKGENALNNSTGVTVNGDGIKDNGDIILDTANVTGKGMTVALGKDNTFNAVDVTTTSGKNGVYVASDIKTGNDGTSSVEVKYNSSLFEDGKINAVNNAAMNTNDIFENTDLNVRKQQMEKIYYSNIFAKTVKASYTGVKLVEDKISDLSTTTEVGKWTAMGTGLYNVNKNKEQGFENKIETSGLVGSMEYGLNPTTSVGVALSGAYQDVKAATGKADGELMYVGTYAKKEYGPYKLIAGLGYQYGRYKADNTTGYVSSSNKYSTNTFSTYIEGRYTMNVGDAVSIEPKLKLGYTYVDQEDAKDTYIGVSDANLSTFDTEVGADLVKTIAIENGKVDMTFGASYVRAMGDTDKDFTGEFAKSNGTFDIVGANLAKNTGKFDLSVKVSKDSGIFYKGGVSYQVGSDKTRDYGVNVGLGYKF